ncbi:MAG: hypothetical protein CM15mP112_00140 [Flavobacteriales bacterium]|nr:MAG: hypothetical protein CM15mP112_00140 [Flavobacteriales bacterium]
MLIPDNVFALMKHIIQLQIESEKRNSMTSVFFQIKNSVVICLSQQYF